jgi:hypothetical protein
MEEVMMLSNLEGHIERRDVARLLLTLIQGAVTFPFPQVCKHLVAYDLLDVYQQLFGMSAETDTLAKSLVSARNTEATETISALLARLEELK